MKTPDAPAIPVIETDALFAAPADAMRPVLKGVSLRIPNGSRAVLTGANGAGKSTLLKTFAGLLQPLSGRVLINGISVTRHNPDVAFLAQRAAIEWLFPVTVRQVVLAGCFPRLGWLRRLSAHDRQRASYALRLLDLEPLASRPLHTLSGGQRQRVLLARAFCQEAKILLLDEPFAGLDSPNRDILTAFLTNAPSCGFTILMASHDPDGEARDFDILFKIRDGQLEPASLAHK
ncbi:MAG: metal ABC transporter ATP-binding protein [Puniceicoccales bacterium]|nr:metal ABC transporter ATP-binding protein [Puniceicoccales bacterium]